MEGHSIKQLEKSIKKLHLVPTAAIMKGHSIKQLEKSNKKLKMVQTATVMKGQSIEHLMAIKPELEKSNTDPARKKLEAIDIFFMDEKLARKKKKKATIGRRNKAAGFKN